MAKFSVAAVGDFMLVQRIHPEDKSALAIKMVKKYSKVDRQNG